MVVLCRGLVMYVYVGSMPTSKDGENPLRPSAGNYPHLPSSLSTILPHALRSTAGQGEGGREGVHGQTGVRA